MVTPASFNSLLYTPFNRAISLAWRAMTEKHQALSGRGGPICCQWHSLRKLQCHSLVSAR